MIEKFVPDRLTSSGHNSTLRSEGKFMSEGATATETGVIEPQELGQKPSEESLKLKARILESKRKITPDKIKSAKEAWDEENKKAKEAGKPLSTDIATQRIYIESGVPPYRTPEYVRPFHEERARRENRPLTEAELENIALGIPPISGGAVGPPGVVSPAAVQAIIERGRLTAARVPELFGSDPKVRDEYFRSIFEIVDASPHEFFQQAFSFENQQRLTEFMTMVMNASREPLIDPGLRAQLEVDFDRYQLERRLREGIHNVNAILYIPSVKADQLYEHLQSVESLIGDVAHRVLGTVEMANILERVLREEMRKNNGYLRPEAITGRVETDKVPRIDPVTGAAVLNAAGVPIYDDVVVRVEEGDVERRVKEIFNQQVARNNGLYTREDNGSATLINKTFQSWEVDTVFTTARATMIMSGRLLSIAAEGKLGAGDSHYSSLFLQDILQGYSSIIHTVGKFGITEENLAILLHDPDEKVKKVFGLLSMWNPKKYEQAYKDYTKNPKSILESDDDFFELQKQNPMRVGDLMTIATWRYLKNPEEPSAIQDFIARGRERMHTRWNAHHLGDPAFDIYEEFIHRTQFVVPRNAKEAEKEAILKNRRQDWEAAHPGVASIDDYLEYANEYFKWIGTAVRFETLRTTMDKLQKPPKGNREALKLWKRQLAMARAEANKPNAKNEDRERAEKLEDADRILQRMVELQPHRLYDKSPDIRKRVNEKLFTFLGYPDEAHQTPAQKAVVDQLLSNFYLMENVLLTERERLLDEGKTFDSHRLSLNEFLRRTDIITDAGERQLARKFLQLFLEDYRSNKDKYLVELVYKRNYKHGFVLWSGDIPLNEYRFTAWGPTGSFVRRARDNKTTGEASVELFKLMGKLPEMQNINQAIPFLRVIYDKIANYSPDRAKEVVTDAALGIAKFVVARPTTNIPGWGFFEKKLGKPSFSKIVYGETGLTVGATEVRNFFNVLYRNEHMITKEKYKDITKDKIPASTLDTAVDIGSTMSQLIALAILVYFMSQLAKSKH